jgi:hypothetical protein
MIKRFFTGVFLMASTFAVNAQTVVVSSNFSSWTNNLPDGWMGSKTNIEFNAPYDSVLQVTNGVVYGTAAVRLVNTGTSHKRFTSQTVSVTQTQTYEAKFWVRGKGDVRLGLFDNDLSNGDFGYTYANYINVNSSAWTMYTQTIVADTTYNLAEFILSIKSTDAAQNHLEFDSIAIYTVSSPPPPPPANCVESNFSSWTGGIPNGWKGSRTNFDFVAPFDSIVQVTSGAVYGTSAVRLINPGTTHVRFSSQTTSVTQGQAYEAKFWVRGKGDIRFGIYDNDLSNGDFGYTYAPYLSINSTAWTMQSQTLVADTTYSLAEFILSIKSTDGAQNHLEIDSIAICPVTSPPPPPPTTCVQSNFSSWTNGIPNGWKGSRTNFDFVAPFDSIVEVTSGAVYGTSAVRLINPGTTHVRFSSQSLAVTEGQAYEAKFWIRGKGDIRFGLYDNDQSNGDFGYSYAPYLSINSSSWTLQTQQIVADTNFNTAEFIFSIKATDGTMNHLEIDSVSICPVTQSVTSIYDIQYNTNSNGSSNFANTNVLTGGIVTAIHSTGFFVQSGTGPWSGIFVFTTAATPSRGDSVTFSALVEEYFGMTQLKNVTNFSVISSGNNVPATVVTTTQAGTEAYEGVLVKVEFATCSNANAGFGEWTVWNSPTSINIDDMIFPYTPTQGAAYDVTGPVYFSFNTYKILPRDANDIVLVSQVGMQESQLENIKVYPNPAASFVTVENNVQMNADMQVLDARGAVVKQIKLNNTSERIDVSDLANGIYHIRLVSSEGLAQYKLVIQK